MKVFACQRQGSYSGGLIIVATNTIEEAYKTFFNDERFDWMIEAHDANYEWRDKNDEDAIVESYYYPLEKWYEIESLTADVTEPQVIAENGYSE